MDAMTDMELESDDQLEPMSEDEIEDQSEFNSSSSHTTHIPEVREEIKPKLYQEFDSLDDARDFYNNYAREAGFNVRTHSSKKSGGKLQGKNLCATNKKVEQK